MAIVIINGDRIGPGVGVTIGAGANLLVTTTGKVIDESSGATGLNLTSNNVVTVLGTIGGEAAGIATLGQGGHAIAIGTTGIVFNQLAGAALRLLAAADGGPSRLDNAGLILSADGSGVELQAAGSDLFNAGQVRAALAGVQLIHAGQTFENTGVVAAASGVVVATTGAGARIVNSGTIQADLGIQVTAPTAWITNLGRITGGLDLGLAEVRLDNAGVIEGGVRYTTGLETKLGGVATNTGEILAGANGLAWLGIGFAEQITNAGRIVGRMDLRDGNDLYEGSAGRLLGRLDGNAGADTLIGGLDNESLVGGSGNDSLSGGGGDDTLFGGTGADELDGGAGVDRLDYFGMTTTGVNVNLASLVALAGEAEGDLILGFEQVGGTSQNDTLTAAAGAETLLGRFGDDALAGLAGADRLLGNEGADTLEGGAGGDILLGGTGNDRFVFAAVADSTAATAGRDRIADFSNNPMQGFDLIDLAAIDAVPGGADNPFVFIGAAAFSAAGQVRAVIQAGARTLVEAETTGDNKADFAILLSGPVTLTGADFVL